MGGTRSTYRGNSTQLFRQKMQQGSDGNGNGSNSSKNKGNNNRSSDTGGIDGNGNGNGEGGSVVEQPKQDTVNQQEPQLTDEQLLAQFYRSNEYKEFTKKDYRSDDAFEKAEKQAFTKWMQGQGLTPNPAPGGEEEPPPAPKPAAPLDKFRRSPSVPQTEAELKADLVYVNPHYDDPHFSMTAGTDRTARQNVRNRVNCQRCVVTHEARNRGYDVTAVSVEEGWKPVRWDERKKEHLLDIDSADSTEIASLFDKEDGTHPQWEWATGSTRISKANNLENKVKAWGEGARGIVFVTWNRNRGAHVFNVHVKNGEVIYSDGQTNEYGEEVSTGLQSWKLKFSPSSRYNGVLRVDNTTINDRGTTWMKERGNLSINAPSLAEISAFIENKSPEEQALWMHVWQQIRSGDRTTMLQSMANNDEAMRVAREAAAWIRRPD